MKKIFLLALFLILCIPITAQHAIRKELGDMGVIKFTAYHFTESGEYLFVMNANYFTRINGADGSISTDFELFAGDQYQAREIMHGWAELIDKNPSSDEAAFRMGNVMIHRRKWRKKGYNELVLPGGHVITLWDETFKGMYTNFIDYWEDQALGGHE